MNQLPSLNGNAATREWRDTFGPVSVVDDTATEAIKRVVRGAGAHLGKQLAERGEVGFNNISLLGHDPSVKVAVALDRHGSPVGTIGMYEGTDEVTRIGNTWIPDDVQRRDRLEATLREWLQSPGSLFDLLRIDCDRRDGKLDVAYMPDQASSLSVPLWPFSE